MTGETALERSPGLDIADRIAAAHRAQVKRVDWLPYVVAVTSALVLAVFIAYPISQIVLSAFLPRDLAFSLAKLSFANFANFIDQPLYQEAFFHSLYVVAWSTFIATVIALPAAYAVARVDIPCRNLILALSVIPIVAPPFIGAFAWVYLLGRQGIITHYLNVWLGIVLPSIYGPFGIILALSLHFFPFVFLFVQGALSAADPYIEESAQVMGASRLQIIRTITLPLALPAIAAGAVLVFVRSLGSFGVPAILGRDYFVLPTLIVYQIHGRYDMNAASAIAVVSVGLTIIALLLVRLATRRRRFVTVTGTTRAAKRHAALPAKIAANAYVWLLLFVGVLPHLMVVFSAFAEWWPGTVWPKRYGFGNFREIAHDLPEVVSNSLLLSGIATMLCVVFGTLAAYVSMRKKFIGRWLLDATIMLPFIIPGIITGVAFIVSFNTGLIVLTGTGLIIIMAYFIQKTAYTFRAVSAAISQVDDKMEEASTICGASWGRTMRKITIPLVAPGILAGGILVFSTLVVDLSITILLFSADWKTIAIKIYEQLNNSQYQTASANGAISVLITLALVFMASRLIGKNMADMFR